MVDSSPKQFDVVELTYTRRYRLAVSLPANT